jgi:hypothetical protein
MTPSREHLLGYLLGALDRAESDQVERELDDSPALREELSRLQHSLSCVGLLDEPEHYDPPAGLAARVCHFVAVQKADDRRREKVRLSPVAIEYHPQRRFTWVDLFVSAAVLIAGFAVLFPALSHSQFQARIAGCQNHLRQVGMALHDAAGLRPDRSFPEIPSEGNLAVAGSYAPMLVSQGLVSNPAAFDCPSARRDGTIPLNNSCSSIDAINAAVGAQLAAMQRTMGGDFAYPLGYVEDGKVVPVRDERRSSYPLLSDAPSDAQPGRVSGNHGGRGQNVFFEDGHIEWCPKVAAPHLLDDPYHNYHGEVAAGLDRNDSVLGASHDRPRLPVQLISE